VICDDYLHRHVSGQSVTGDKEMFLDRIHPATPSRCDQAISKLLFHSQSLILWG
jgi:hypothetical protein